MLPLRTVGGAGVDAANEALAGELTESERRYQRRRRDEWGALARTQSS